MLVTNDVQGKYFFEDLGLLIVKNHIPLNFLKSSWFKIFSMHLCPIIVFLSRKQFSIELLSKLMGKTKQLYVLPTLI